MIITYNLDMHINYLRKKKQKFGARDSCFFSGRVGTLSVPTDYNSGIVYCLKTLSCA